LLHACVTYANDTWSVQVCLHVHATWLKLTYSLGCFLTISRPACSDSETWIIVDPLCWGSSYSRGVCRSAIAYLLQVFSWPTSGILLLLLSIYQFLFFVNLFINHTFAPPGEIIFLKYWITLCDNSVLVHLVGYIIPLCFFCILILTCTDT